MSGFVPVGKILTASYSNALGFELLDALQSVPLSDTEILAVSHHFPICVRTEGHHSSVRALVGRRYMARPLVDNRGKWNGCYKPIALRCAPFRLRSNETGNPLVDLEIWEGALASPGADGSRHDVMPICNSDGKLSHQLGTYFTGLRHAQTQQNNLVAGLDQLFLAGLLSPLTEDGHQSMTYSYATLSDFRFDALTKRALEAMARQTFAGIELATAMIFSQMHLVRDMRPAIVERLSLKHLRDDSQATALMTATLDTLEPWLDESDLFSLEDFAGTEHLPDTFAK
jgi:hypothetical protein